MDEDRSTANRGTDSDDQARIGRAEGILDPDVNPEHARDIHLGHVHLKVTDIERSIDFYTDVLDFEVSERVDRFAFLTLGSHHHDLALQAVGTHARGRRVVGPAVGLYHVAFEVATDDRLTAVYRRLERREVAVSPVDHGISLALYFDDPDGNGVEVYRDVREERDRWQWGGRNEPFDPRRS